MQNAKSHKSSSLVTPVSVTVLKPFNLMISLCRNIKWYLCKKFLLLSQ